MEKNFAQVYKFNTKEFWKNYWFYYKPHTLWGIFALIVIVGSIRSCVTKIEPDFSIMYVGKTSLLASEPAEPVFEKYINDIDEDGNKSVLITNLAIGDGKDAQMAQAAITKADIEIAVGEPMIFMTDEQFINRYVEMEGYEDVAEITDNIGIPEDRIVKNIHGSVVAVDVTGTEFAKIMGVLSNDKVYIGVKVMPLDKQNNEDYVRKHNEVLRMYEFILKDKFN